MQVNLDQKLIFPSEILTSLRPDWILWSTLLNSLYIVELTVPWEEVVGKAHKCKRLKYSSLAAAEMGYHGWKTQVLPLELGCRGIVATTSTKKLKQMEVVAAGSSVDRNMTSYQQEG